MKKAFLLGAGLGTRLRPLTDTAPKPLVPVFHRPLAMHVLDHLASAGITEVAVNTHHLADSWRETFPDGRYRNLELTFFHEPIYLKQEEESKTSATSSETIPSWFLMVISSVMLL